MKGYLEENKCDVGKKIIELEEYLNKNNIKIRYTSCRGLTLIVDGIAFLLVDEEGDSRDILTDIPRTFDSEKFVLLDSD